MKFFSLLTVTLCATVFCACSSYLPSKKSELMTGEQTAKAAGDSAREAEKGKTTGILVGSSNDFIEKKVEPESRPIEKVAEPLGSKVYLDNCAACHGKDGKAGIIPLTAGTLDTIARVTREGRPELGMPAWKTRLSEAELTAVAQYVYAFRNTLETP